MNDQKAGRVYGHWHYLPKLAPEVHKIKIVLYTHDHRPYFNDGAPISDEVEIVVAGTGLPQVVDTRTLETPC